MGGKTSNESKRKYNEKTYDRIQLVVKKGKKDEIKAFAESHGYTLNGFVNEAIDDKMRGLSSVGDGLSPGAAEAPPAPEVAEIVPELSEEIPTAPARSEDISVLDLSVRTFNIICRAGVRTVAELEAWVHSDQCCLNPERSPGYKEILAALETYKENTPK